MGKPKPAGGGPKCPMMVVVAFACSVGMGIVSLSSSSLSLLGSAPALAPSQPAIGGSGYAVPSMPHQTSEAATAALAAKLEHLEASATAARGAHDSEVRQLQAELSSLGARVRELAVAPAAAAAPPAAPAAPVGLVSPAPPLPPPATATATYTPQAPPLAVAPLDFDGSDEEYGEADTVLKPLWGMKHRRNVDVVFGLMFGYGKIDYQRFVGSLRHIAGFKGDIVLATSPEEKMKPGVAECVAGGWGLCPMHF